jgi:outer membrane protein TolC
MFLFLKTMLHKKSALIVIFAATFGLSLGASMVSAGELRPFSYAGPLTLGELIEAGLRDNPGLNAKKLQWKRVEKRYPQARSLEDPVLAYTQAISEVETRLGPVRRSVMLSQKLPFPGKLKLKGDIVNKEAEIARLAFKKAARELVLAIKRAYFDLYYLDKARALAKERIWVFKHFTEAERNDYSIGVTGFSDVISAESRFADAEYDLILFTELRREAESRMNTLLNRNPEALLPPLNEPRIKAAMNNELGALGELYTLTGKNEELLMANLLIEKGSLKEKLSGFTSKPNFMVGLKYTEIGEPDMSGVKDGGKDAVAVTIGMTLPLWTTKNRAAKDEAILARMVSERAKAAASDSLKARVKKAFVDMRSNYQLAKLYSDSLVPKAEKLIEISQINYKNGRGSIADLFEARVMRINFSLAYHRAATNYMKNLAELERLTATYALKEVATND